MAEGNLESFTRFKGLDSTAAGRLRALVTLISHLLKLSIAD